MVFKNLLIIDRIYIYDCHLMYKVIVSLTNFIIVSKAKNCRGSLYCLSIGHVCRDLMLVFRNMKVMLDYIYICIM